MTDPLLTSLSALADAPAPDLVDRVVDHWVRAPGPLGDVLVASGTDGVRLLRTADTGTRAFCALHHERFGRPLVPGPAPRGLLPALRGARTRPAIDLGGSTDFERDVLAATATIPAGETRPYAWVAREAGRPRAVRAVGTVLAGNPVPLLVPCHRVTRSDGSLGQYMFGTPAKAAVLRGEGADVDGLAALADAGTTHVGSDTTGIVCLPSCHHARRITDAHRRRFRGLARALDDGYRPCRHCRPA